MTILEAFEATKKKAEELKEFGIEVEFVPYSKKNHSQVYLDELKQKYPDIPMDKWGTIKLKATNPIHFEKINDANNYLSMIGIGFDRGGCNGVIDWELDWSFSYTGEERAEDIQATNDLMDRLKYCGTEEN